MSPSVVDHRIVWDGPSRGDVFSRTIEMQTWTGERVDVIVDPEVAALIVVDGDVRNVLFTGTHAVHVLRQGEEPGDVDAREFAERMRSEAEDLKWLRHRARHLRAKASLVFVSVGALVYVEFGRTGPLPFRDRRRGDVALEIHGVARLAVVDPVAFHATFLARTEDLRQDDFERIVAALVESGLGKALEAATDDVDAIEPDPATLAIGALNALRPQFAALGLDVEAIDVTRLETPAGSPLARTANVVRLATPADHG